MPQAPLYQTEVDEREHMLTVRTTIIRALEELGGTVDNQLADIGELKKYLQDSKAEMDHVEKISVRQSVDQMTRIGEHQVAQARRLSRLCQSPYFGRIDFQDHHAAHAKPIYIGIHAFFDEPTQTHMVHDWRAPVSSMFYDFEPGPAWFDAPAGRTHGRITLKRQYRIKDGQFIFMLETALNIQDDILQEELSRATDDKMRNIVATIQRDQNAIIRNENTPALIIQGAAGSGKTSIALHRIAFLLYRHKDTITSDDILIISPNQVFAHYISQVLPELGEDMIKETTMEALADYLLDGKVKFQTFQEQVAQLLEDADVSAAERIRFKSTTDFMQSLHAYATHLKNTNFKAVFLEVGEHILPAFWIHECLHRCGAIPFAEQVNYLTEAAVTRMQREYRVKITGRHRTAMRTQIKAMYRTTDCRTLYKDFYAWLGKPEFFQPLKGRTWEYADIFPLIYLQFLIEGVKQHDPIKHLVVDEMQDYTPVQYQVLAALFSCPKTILGDRHQSVNPMSASSAETIQQVLSNATCMVMNKSYRSTLEISSLAQRICHNPDLIPIARHGSPPAIIATRNPKSELAAIHKTIDAFRHSGHHSLGIVCKTQKQADNLHAKLSDSHPGTFLIKPDSNTFRNGIIIASAHLAKGLEFDEVIIPHCSADNYQNTIDRHMLYVACTRAMHRLTLTHTGTLSSFLQAT